MTKCNISKDGGKESVYLSLINPKVMDGLKDKIIDALLVKKKYKDKKYSAKELSKELDTNARYISAVINVKFHTNYSKLVNKYRIEDAMALLVDRRYKNLNMEDISDMVGFSNSQSFYTAFNQINGCTPREYKLSHLPRYQSTDSEMKGKGVKDQEKDRREQL